MDGFFKQTEKANMYEIIKISRSKKLRVNFLSWAKSTNLRVQAFFLRNSADDRFTCQVYVSFRVVRKACKLTTDRSSEVRPGSDAVELPAKKIPAAADKSWRRCEVIEICKYPARGCSCFANKYLRGYDTMMKSRVRN